MLEVLFYLLVHWNIIYVCSLFKPTSRNRLINIKKQINQENNLNN